MKMMLIKSKRMSHSNSTKLAAPSSNNKNKMKGPLSNKKSLLNIKRWTS